MIKGHVVFQFPNGNSQMIPLLRDLTTITKDANNMGFRLNSYTIVMGEGTLTSDEAEKLTEWLLELRTGVTYKEDLELRKLDRMVSEVSKVAIESNTIHEFKKGTGFVLNV